MSKEYSDAALQATVTRWKEGPTAHLRNGYARAAGYLLQLPEDVRADADSEAHIRTNVVGGRYADQVRQVVENWLAGDREFPYVEANYAMLRRERTSRDPRTGARVIEPMGVAFAGLPVHPSVQR